MRPRKVVVLHCLDETAAAQIRMLLTNRLNCRVLTVGVDSLEHEEADAYVVYRDLQAASLIAEHGHFQRTVLLGRYDAFLLMQRVQLACVRKRGPKAKVAA